MLLAFLATLALVSGAEYHRNRGIDIRIDGEITDLSQQEEELNSLVRAGKELVVIQINSPGGGVGTTGRFVESMVTAHSYGTQVACVVKGEAYSAALVILSFCDKRYALYGSRVMFHSAKMGIEGYVGMVEAAAIYKDLEQVNSAIWARVAATLPPAYFYANFVQERLIPSAEIESVSGGNLLKVIKSLDEIE